MVNYQNGKIYKMINEVDNWVYIGSSTMNYLSTRRAGHCVVANDEQSRLHTPLYEAMRKYGNDKFHIVLIKLFPCSSRAELEAEEYSTVQQMIKDGHNLYNLRLAQTGFGHREDSKQKIKEAMMGRVITEEHKQRISTGLKQKFINEPKKGGKDHTRFNFGCISFEDKGQNSRWTFSSKEFNKQHKTSFGCNKYGYGQAKQLAEAERLNMYPEWEKTQDKKDFDELAHLIEL